MVKIPPDIERRIKALQQGNATTKQRMRTTIYRKRREQTAHRISDLCNGTSMPMPDALLLTEDEQHLHDADQANVTPWTPEERAREVEKLETMIKGSVL